MLDDQRLVLAKHRLSQAKEDYEGGEKNLAISEYKIANNRAYYSIFHAMRAILALDGIDFKKHSGVISYFREHYLKTGLFDKKYSDIIGDASLLRNKSDYDDFYIASGEDAREQITNAKIFFLAVEKYIEQYQRA